MILCTSSLFFSSLVCRELLSALRFFERSLKREVRMLEHLSVGFYKHTISDDHVVCVRMCISAHIIIIQLELHYCAMNTLYEEPPNN